MVNLNDKSGDIAITMLVFMTLVMAGASLFIFYIHDGLVVSQIQDSRFLDELYLKDNKLDFYLNDIMDKSVIKINNREDPIPEFTNNFKIELSKYKIQGNFILDELSQVESQVTPENIHFDGKVISITLNLNLKSSYEEKFLVSSLNSRNYSRTLSKGF